MKKWMCLLVGLLLIVSSCKKDGHDSRRPPEHPKDRDIRVVEWSTTTPAGIRVLTLKTTIIQYEDLWGLGQWEKIQWGALDNWFEVQKKYYCYDLDWKCKNVRPSSLMVYIHEWDGRCVDAESPNQPREIYENLAGWGWVCVDGWFDPPMAYIHLGDDPGQDNVLVNGETGEETFWIAFEATAFPHELIHFFQWVAGRRMEELGQPGQAGQTMLLDRCGNFPNEGGNIPNHVK